MIENVQKTNGKNGLVELFRFLFAFWIVYYHGWFVVSGPLFERGYVGVEFFFMLSGYYLFKSFARYDDKPFFKSWWQFLKKRIIPLAIPLVISAIFTIWYKLAFSFRLANLFVYMWYVPYMFLAFFMAFVIYRIAKSDALRIIIFSLFALTTYLIYWITGFSWGMIRAVGGVSLGILLSYLKPIVIRWGKLNLNVVAFALVCIGIFTCAILPKPDKTLEIVLAMALFPCLIYLLSTVSIKSKACEFLGSISFSLYAYQTVPLVLYKYFPIEKYWYFIIICALTIITYIVVTAIKKSAEKKRLEKCETAAETNEGQNVVAK